MVMWKTILIIVLGLILIVVILLLIFSVMRPTVIGTKLSQLLETLDKAIRSLFDISEWPW